jgi:polycomb protein EED
MASTFSFNKAYELPKLRKILKTSLDNPDSEANHFWDAKFYPFDHNREAPPVFALNNKRNIMVCRISPQEDNDIEVIRVFAIKGEDHFSEHYCSCTWAFIDPSEPLILGAGEAGVVRVYDVVHGTLKTSLLGHGQGIINDLATHPKYPWIVASASQDTSIRIWDLRRWNNKQESPCIAICGHGNGHRETLLSVSWHDSGRYIISGAHDHRICVWTMPDLSLESRFWEEISPSQRKRSSDEVKVIHYPHFVT